MARPPKQIDEKQVERLAAMGCSEREIGQIVGCSDRLLERCFVGALKRGWAQRNYNLRKLQYEAAKRGSAVMLVWAGQPMARRAGPTEPEDATNPLDELLAEFRKRNKLLRNAEAASKERE